MECPVKKRSLEIDMCAKVTLQLFQEYQDAVVKGLSHMLQLADHKNNYDRALFPESIASVQDTLLVINDPDIIKKLEFTIRKEMNCEEEAIELVLKNLEDISVSIIKNCDRVFSILSVCKQNGFSLEELSRNEIDSYSIAKKVEAFDLFKQKFTKNHLAQAHCLDYFYKGEEIKKLTSLWNIEDLKIMENELCFYTLGGKGS